MKRSALALLTALLLAAPLRATEAIAPELVTSSQDGMEYLPQVAYDSAHDEYLAVWHDYDTTTSPQRRILARRLDRYGRPLSAVLVVSPTGDTRDRAQPALAYDSTNDRFLLVYVLDYYGNGSDWDVRGRYLSWDAVNRGAEFTIGASASHEWHPQIDYSYLSDKFLVAWTVEPASGYTSVRGALVAQQTVSETAIASSASANRLNPDLAYQPYGDNFLVVYDSAVDVFGTTVTAAGGVGSEVAIAAWPDPESNPAVASCDNFQFVVVWQSTVPGAGNEVYARFLYGDGTIYTAPIHISGSTANEQHPDIACTDGGIDYLIAWEQQYSTSQYGISGRRITGTQALRPAFAVRAVSAGETGVTFNPRLAGGESGWLAVWEHQRQGSPYLDIHNRAVWSLFADGFEWGNTNLWSAVAP